MLGSTLLWVWGLVSWPRNSSSENKNTNSINQGSAHSDRLKVVSFPADPWYWRNDMSILPAGCDKCIWDLTDDLRLAALSIEESKSGLLSVSSGAAAHRHVNEINSTIYLLKVCRNGVPSACFHSDFTGSFLITLISFSIWFQWLCYRLWDLGNSEKWMVVQELSSIKKVNMANESTTN